MGRTIPPFRKLLVATVAAGALALGTAGVAGASGPTATAGAGAPVATTPHATGAAGRLRHFSCARAPKALTRIQKRIDRLSRPGEVARLQKLEKAIGAKCDGSAPVATP